MKGFIEDADLVMDDVAADIIFDMDAAAFGADDVVLDVGDVVAIRNSTSLSLM